MRQPRAPKPTAKQARASPCRTPKTPRRARFAAGRLAFEAGRFEDALQDFLRAYELSGRPELLYNVASTYLRRSQGERALAYFERYLTELPDADNRDDAEARIEELRALLATRAAEESRDSAMADPVPSSIEPASAEERPAGWPFLLMSTLRSLCTTASAAATSCRANLATSADTATAGAAGFRVTGDATVTGLLRVGSRISTTCEAGPDSSVDCTSR